MTAAMVTAALEATAAKPSPKGAKPFHEGDAVVYPAHGVGRVDRVGPEEIGGHQLNLIHISFADDRMTLRIPVAQARATGLRRLASKETLAAALITLRGRPRASRLIWSKRSQEYLAKINTGNPAALAEVLRDLQATGGSTSQRTLFDLARDRLADELAAVNRIGRPEAVALLDQTLVEAKAQTERPRPKVDE